MDKASKEEIFKKRLRKELVSRDGHGYVVFFFLETIQLKTNKVYWILVTDISCFFCNIVDRELTKDTTISLQFKNKELEANYTQQRESMSSVPLIASVLVHIVASVYSSFILPSSAIHFFVIIVPLILTLPIVWISVAESFDNVCYHYLILLYLLLQLLYIMTLLNLIFLKRPKKIYVTWFSHFVV